MVAPPRGSGPPGGRTAALVASRRHDPPSGPDGQQIGGNDRRGVGGCAHPVRHNRRPVLCGFLQRRGCAALRRWRRGASVATGRKEQPDVRRAAAGRVARARDPAPGRRTAPRGPRAGCLPAAVYVGFVQPATRPVAVETADGLRLPRAATLAAASAAATAARPSAPATTRASATGRLGVGPSRLTSVRWWSPRAAARRRRSVRRRATAPRSRGCCLRCRPSSTPAARCR